MLKVEVKTTDVQTIEKKDKTGSYQLQKAYCFTYDRNGRKPYPEEITLFVPKINGNPTPYPVGMYDITPDSFRVGQYGKLEVGFINLQPVSK